MPGTTAPKPVPPLNPNITTQPPSPIDNLPPGACSEPATFLRTLHDHGGVFEIRAPKSPLSAFNRDHTSTASGYFNEIAKAAAAATQLDCKNMPPGVYVTLNPVAPDLLARSNNAIDRRAKATTGDADIVRRRWLFLDFDPKRLAGISSTDAEMQAALDLAEHVREVLAGEGWPEPLRGMSGNGGYLLYRIDVPNDADADALIKKVTGALADRFSTDEVDIDRTTHNASRIVKVLGTTARKGSDLQGQAGIDDRPHRQSWFYPPTRPLEIVTREQLEAIASSGTQAAPKSTRPATATVSRSNGANGFAHVEGTVDSVRACLESHGLTITGKKRIDDATLLHLDRCPASGVEAHGTDISVIVNDNGRIGYKNHHNRGEGIRWIDVREALEPGYKAHGERQDDRVEIEVTADEHDVADQVIAALANDPHLYQRGSKLVRVLRGDQSDGVARSNDAPVIRLAPAPYLRERLTRACHFKKFDARAKGFKQAHPPTWLVQAVEARGEWPGIRPLLGVSDIAARCGTLKRQDSWSWARWHVFTGTAGTVGTHSPLRVKSVK